MGSSDILRLDPAIFFSQSSIHLYDNPPLIRPTSTGDVHLEHDRTIFRILHDKIIQAAHSTLHHHPQKDHNHTNQHIFLPSQDIRIAGFWTCYCGCVGVLRVRQ